MTIEGWYDGCDPFHLKSCEQFIGVLKLPSFHGLWIELILKSAGTIPYPLFVQSKHIQTTRGHLLRATTLGFTPPQVFHHASVGAKWVVNIPIDITSPQTDNSQLTIKTPPTGPTLATWKMMLSLILFGGPPIFRSTILVFRKYILDDDPTANSLREGCPVGS